MTNLYSELIDILNEEKKVLEALFKIVSEERDAIVGLNSSELEKILREKEQILVKLSLWEEERIKLLNKYGLKKSNISEIIKSCNDLSISEKLKDLYNTMKTLLSAISDIQKINEQLIDRSISNIGAAIKFLETFGITPKRNLSMEA
ncbi:MAG: flagellar protein FlgN [Thermodesulfovibrio sp.]|nr:flagellar protein FlgN [Thermodesulfovibrio sp.]MDW7999020.1 flagellar protein FlgN [Thermodesulfovibrio sp.]